MKKAGILMPVVSLPNKYGVGDFGKESYEFIDLLEDTKVKIWQILPLNPLGYGNSPYQPYSSFAMDEIYLSLDSLKEEGLISEISEYNDESDKVEYEKVRAFKQPYLMEAFETFNNEDALDEFVQENEWVYDYACFMVLKKKNDNKAWNEWTNKKMNAEDTKAMYYQIFIQMKLYEQWLKLKAYANKKKIEILGDVPFYVGYDSVDVYKNQKCFLLDKDGKPSCVAGVPPDYFSKTGQRWGNPIYDWDYLKNHGFNFWVDRLAKTMALYDIIRIDHFRAFDTYWKVNAACETAIDGKWCEAPGYAFFDTLYAKYPKIKLVAEDLGDLRPEVLTLRDHYHLKGMNIIQFHFDPVKETKIKKNMIIYTGTHDNDTLKGWYDNLKAGKKAQFTKYFKKHDMMYKNINKRFIEYAVKSNCEFAILSLFDVLNKDNNYRINTPGTIGYPNWMARLKDKEEIKEGLAMLKDMISEAKR